jgi:hypothetical protein
VPDFSDTVHRFRVPVGITLNVLGALDLALNISPIVGRMTSTRSGDSRPG